MRVTGEKLARCTRVHACTGFVSTKNNRSDNIVSAVLRRTHKIYLGSHARKKKLRQTLSFCSR